MYFNLFTNYKLDSDISEHPILRYGKKHALAALEILHDVDHDVILTTANDLAYIIDQLIELYCEHAYKSIKDKKSFTLFGRSFKSTEMDPTEFVIDSVQSIGTDIFVLAIQLSSSENSEFKIKEINKLYAVAALMEFSEAANHTSSAFIELGDKFGYTPYREASELDQLRANSSALKKLIKCAELVLLAKTVQVIETTDLLSLVSHEVELELKQKSKLGTDACQLPLKTDLGLPSNFDPPGEWNVSVFGPLFRVGCDA